MAQAVLSDPVLFSVCFSCLPTTCYTGPNSYPTKSQLTSFCMPAGRDVVIFVLFTAVKNSAFDYIVF